MGQKPSCTDRSHAPRGNASRDALRHCFESGRGASRAAFPRRAWERSDFRQPQVWRSPSSATCCPRRSSPAPVPGRRRLRS
ncbi:hypothetical protein CUU62_11485 [Pseudomonas sp. WP001]|nr:hypothetical protein CUU62_11485 [Pseudomonas sp. WP001]